MGILYRSINETDAVFLKNVYFELLNIFKLKHPGPVVMKVAVLPPGPWLQNISELLQQRQNSSGYQTK